MREHQHQPSRTGAVYSHDDVDHVPLPRGRLPRWGAKLFIKCGVMSGVVRRVC